MQTPIIDPQVPGAKGMNPTPQVAIVSAAYSLTIRLCVGVTMMTLLLVTTQYARLDRVRALL